MNSTPFVFETLVRENHLDSLGHVNNSKYMEFFEQARWEMITQAGFGLSEVQKSAQGPIVLEANIKFRKELHNREKIRIENRAIEVKSKILVLEQTLFNEAGAVSAVALITMAYLDLRLRKMVSLPKDWLKAMGGELKAAEAQ